MSWLLIAAGAIGALISQFLGFLFQALRGRIDQKAKTLDDLINSIDELRDIGLEYWTAAKQEDDDETRLLEAKILSSQKRFVATWAGAKSDLREARRVSVADQVLELIRASTDDPFGERNGKRVVQRAHQIGAITAKMIGEISREKREIFTGTGIIQVFSSYWSDWRGRH